MTISMWKPLHFGLHVFPSPQELQPADVQRASQDPTVTARFAKTTA